MRIAHAHQFEMITTMMTDSERQVRIYDEGKNHFFLPCRMVYIAYGHIYIHTSDSN